MITGAKHRGRLIVDQWLPGVWWADCVCNWSACRSTQPDAFTALEDHVREAHPAGLIVARPKARP